MLIRAGISPLEADEMELWQIASLLDEGDEKPASARAPTSGRASGPPKQSDALLRERVRRHRLGLPKISEDQLEAMDAGAVQQIQKMFLE